MFYDIFSEELQNVEENQEVIEQLQELQTNDRTNTSPCETEQENVSSMLRRNV